MQTMIFAVLLIIASIPVALWGAPTIGAMFVYFGIALMIVYPVYRFVCWLYGQDIKSYLD